MTSKTELTAAKVAAMKAKESFRSATLGSILAAVKQHEVDTRTDVNDTIIVTILNRMVKQRLDSISQFTNAKRFDLVEVEQKELDIIKEFLPAQATDAEISKVIQNAIDTVQGHVYGADLTVKDIGKVMAIVKVELNGKADMTVVSQLVKAKLS